MIGSLADLFEHEGSKVERAAVVSDVRGGEYFEGLVQVLDDLDEPRRPAPAALLEASEDVLINRYKETRRRHPLAAGGSVAAAIAPGARRCSRRCASAPTSRSTPAT